RFRGDDKKAAAGSRPAPGRRLRSGQRPHQLPRVGYMAGYGARYGGQRRGEEGTAALALPALEVPVAGADGVLARRELVAIHGDAHRAAGFTPLGAGGLEDLPQPLGLGLLLHELRARN